LIVATTKHTLSTETTLEIAAHLSVDIAPQGSPPIKKLIYTHQQEGGVRSAKGRCRRAGGGSSLGKGELPTRQGNAGNPLHTEESDSQIWRLYRGSPPAKIGFESTNSSSTTTRLLKGKGKGPKGEGKNGEKEKNGLQFSVREQRPLKL
jgi:hypothetical protein